jgi:hypothetical protein
LKDPEALTEMFEALRLDCAKSADASTAAAAKVDEGTLLFELLDLNRDGQLTRMEIARGFKTLVKAGVPVGVSADAFFKAADGNGDAKVPQIKQKDRQAFRKINKNTWQAALTRIHGFYCSRMIITGGFGRVFGDFRGASRAGEGLGPTQEALRAVL